MKIKTTLKMSIISLGRNPTRTMLTTLGIVIGIGAVITMMEIGNGSKIGLKNKFIGIIDFKPHKSKSNTQRSYVR